ncbi:MAG: T9SS type A sorting domain-containing protein [Chitinophagaceae bacterium]
MLAKCAVLYLLISGIIQCSCAQITVASTNGYVVDINVQPTIVTPSSTSCQYGYNYTVTLSYYISFRGSNLPSSMYTLQGTLGCNSGANFFNLPTNGGNGTTTTSNAWTSTSDCVGVTPSKLGCNTVNIKIEGPGISSQVVSYPVTFGVLPLTLTAFSASSEEDKIKLDWTTSSEVNNQYFIVERSLNQNDWTDLGRIDGAINSIMDRQYSYSDLHPAEGIAYYRLMQVDMDGHFSFSKIVTVDFHSKNGDINVFPIPNRTNTITIKGIANYSEYDLNIIDVNGRVIFSTGIVTSSMNLPQIPEGIYILRFINRLTRKSSAIRYLKL